MSRPPTDHRELELDIAATREAAERLSAALDTELRSLGDRARQAGVTSTLAEVEADLADATARLAAVSAKGQEMAVRTIASMSRPGPFDPEEIRVLKAESEALRDAAEPIRAEIADLNALRAELRRET